METTVALPLPPAVEQPRIDCAGPIAAWSLDMQPTIERIGYRGGRRQIVEVVPLGPTAVEVEIATAQAFLAMRDAAAKSCVDLRLASGFRTLAEQRELFRAWRRGQGNKAARPGQSNHQSGRALDIAVMAAPGVLEWLETNAAAYGFKRTVKSEPWHWEYVDSPIAVALGRKHVARKAIKSAKVIGRATRPGNRASSVRRVAGGRIAASRL